MTDFWDQPLDNEEDFWATPPAGVKPVAAKPADDFWADLPADAPPTEPKPGMPPGLDGLPRLAKAPVLDQLASGAQLGLKKGTHSQDVTKEEYHKDQTGIEMLADIATNVGVGIGVPVAVGAGAVALGAPAAAAATAGLVASGVYGLYQAFGNEWSRSRAEDQSFSPTRMVGQAFLEINPLLKSAKKAITGIRVAAQIAMAGAVEESYSEGDGKFSAGMTLLVSPLMLLGMHERQVKSTLKGVESFAAEIATSKGRGTAREATKLYDSLGDVGGDLTKVADDAVPLEFMTQYVGSGKAKAVRARFAEWRKQVPQVTQNELWEIHNRGKALAQVADEANAKDLQRLSGMSDISAVREAAAPMEYMGRRIDDIADLDAEGTLAGVARAKDKSSLIIKGYTGRANKLDVDRQALGIKPEQLTRALDPDSPGHSVAARRVAAAGGTKLLKEYGDLWTDVLAEVSQHGGLRPDQASALRRALTGADAGAAVASRVKAAATKGGKWWLGEDVVDLRELAAKTAGKELKDLIASDFVDLGTKVQKSVAGLDVVDVPEWAREFDMNKLLSRFLHGNLRSAILAPSLNRAATLVPVLDTLGMPRASGAIQEWLSRQTGATKGLLPKWWSTQMESARRAGQEILAREPDAVRGKLLRDLPEHLAFLNNLAYPANLAWNVRSAFKQAIQPITTLAPELKGAYGYATLARAFVDTLADVGLQPSKLKAFLVAKGQFGDLSEDIGPAAVGAGSKLMRGLKALDEYGMAVFQYFEHTNRTLAHKAGEVWAKDLLAGSPAALSALRSSSAGLRNRIHAAGGANAPAVRLGDVLGDYLIGQTQYRYGDATHAKALAHAGSAFSQFTKWPMMSTWGAFEQIQRRDWGKIASYAAPLAFLFQVKAWMGDHEKDKSTTASMARYLLGDPTSASPVMSIPAMWKTGQGAPLLRNTVAAGAGLTAAVVGSAEAATTRGSTAAKAGKETRALLRGGLRAGVKDLVPGGSAILNEIDRVSESGLGRAAGLETRGGPGKATPTKEVIESLPLIGKKPGER